MSRIKRVPHDEITHWVRWDEPGRVVSKAICGVWIARKKHRNEPTCPDCKRLLAEREASEGPS